ncbi:LysR family transcriptional regulator [Paraburkholderia bryophila]|uniref:DNA-binding transcriptional LysR family regulator n=1 Tax=Paraburkholderia bryophila TaxID=420952 RepID=A0A7Y9WG38_9BURK|nr:LysR family transcriptional regulator [Paraburkholderia bryophila]NYH20102.1 DNA-binding transcriptional LysR family regulator [Paraburkholderia bryophila]
MDRFSSMTIFARVVECGSFTAAAEGSGMTPTMVGNHIRELERRLKGRLLNRTTRRQSLTELGKRYHARCLEILALVDSAELDAREMQSTPRGRLRVSCPVIYGTRVLVPALAAYLDRYPEVQVELSLNDRFVDLAEDGFDAAIRAGVLPDSGLIARPLACSPRIACASPTYLARHGHPRVPADLAQHNCLAFMVATGPEREWVFPRPDGKGVEHIPVRGRLDVNGGLALREAALAGLGIIFQPQMMLQEDLDAGRLVRLFPDWPAQTWPIHLVHLPDAHLPPKLVTFIAFLQETLGHGSEPRNPLIWRLPALKPAVE